MPPKSLPGAAPWSYSKLKAFDTCPRQYYEVKVARNYVEQETEAMRYGNEFHKAAEDYIASDKPIPRRFKYARKMLRTLKEMRGDKHPEIKMGLTEDMDPCGFFEKRRVWYRGIADLIILRDSLAYVFDHKTGQNTKYADPGQLELMALSVFAHYPEVQKIRAALLFPRCRELIKREYTRDDIRRLWDKWVDKFDAMDTAHETGVFNPKESGLCRNHCIVTSCEHNGRNKY